MEKYTFTREKNARVFSFETIPDAKKFLSDPLSMTQPTGSKFFIKNPGVWMERDGHSWKLSKKEEENGK